MKHFYGYLLKNNFRERKLTKIVQSPHMVVFYFYLMLTNNLHNYRIINKTRKSTMS